MLEGPRSFVSKGAAGRPHLRILPAIVERVCLDGGDTVSIQVALKSVQSMSF